MPCNCLNLIVKIMNLGTSLKTTCNHIQCGPSMMEQPKTQIMAFPANFVFFTANPLQQIPNRFSKSLQLQSAALSMADHRVWIINRMDVSESYCVVLY